jgi:hypothetical protein
MKRKIANILAALTLLVVPVLLVPAGAYAACGGGDTSKGQVLNGVGETGADCSSATSDVGNLVSTVVNILSMIVGVAAVIMIVYAGLRYVTSGGDAGSVGNAKSTLVYAIVGIIVAALAQVFVRLALSASS